MTNDKGKSKEGPKEGPMSELRTRLAAVEDAIAKAASSEPAMDVQSLVKVKQSLRDLVKRFEALEERVNRSFQQISQDLAELDRRTRDSRAVRPGRAKWNCKLCGRENFEMRGDERVTHCDYCQRAR